jgi:predicted anti-sigma-YlaC factor YlaD
MNCENYQRQISQLLDNELSRGDWSTLFAHLTTCNECRMFFESSMRLSATINEKMTLLAIERLDEKVRSEASRSSRSESDRSMAKNGLWKRRFSLSLPAIALIEAILVGVVIGVSSLWYENQHPHLEAEARQVQIVALPLVKVTGYSYQP